MIYYHQYLRSICDVIRTRYNNMYYAWPRTICKIIFRPFEDFLYI